MKIPKIIINIKLTINTDHIVWLLGKNPAKRITEYFTVDIWMEKKRDDPTSFGGNENIQRDEG